MSIKPKFLDKILSGQKIVEVRRSFSKRWKGLRATLYSTTPRSAIVGYADIIDVNKDEPDKIWEQYGDSLGCTKYEYDEYSKGKNQLFAVTLGQCEKYIDEIPLRQLSHLLNTELKPPQSYLSLEKNDDWKMGVSIAELLHGRFRLYESTFIR